MTKKILQIVAGATLAILWGLMLASLRYAGYITESVSMPLSAFGGAIIVVAAFYW